MNNVRRPRRLLAFALIAMLATVAGCWSFRSFVCRRCPCFPQYTLPPQQPLPPADQKTEATVHPCPNCQQPIADDVPRCPHCGNVLATLIESPAGAITAVTPNPQQPVESSSATDDWTYRREERRRAKSWERHNVLSICSVALVLLSIVALFAVVTKGVKSVENVVHVTFLLCVFLLGVIGVGFGETARSRKRKDMDGFRKFTRSGIFVIVYVAVLMACFLYAISAVLTFFVTVCDAL